MRLVVADTSPLRYLVQIDEIEPLPKLFDRIFVPTIVHQELSHRSAPEVVRNWIGSRPGWLEITEVYAGDDPSLVMLDEGEKAAIALGQLISADLLLIDDRRGAGIARNKGFEVTDTLGILDLAARRGLVNLADAVARLRNTNFRRRDALFDALLKQHNQNEQT